MNVRGDWEGEYTYVGAKGNSVIDYVLTNGNALDKIVEFKVEDRVDSDHMPICLRIRREEERELDEELEEEEQVRMVIKWDEEAIQQFKENTEEDLGTKEGKQDEREEVTVEELWRNLKGVQNAMIKKRLS